MSKELRQPKPKRLPLLSTTVDKLLTRRLVIVRALHGRKQLQSAANTMADIIAASENMQTGLLELKAAINVPVIHADKGRDASDE